MQDARLCARAALQPGATSYLSYEKRRASRSDAIERLSVLGRRSASSRPPRREHPRAHPGSQTFTPNPKRQRREVCEL